MPQVQIVQSNIHFLTEPSKQVMQHARRILNFIPTVDDMRLRVYADLTKCRYIHLIFAHVAYLNLYLIIIIVSNVRWTEIGEVRLA